MEFSISQYISGEIIPDDVFTMFAKPDTLRRHLSKMIGIPAPSLGFSINSVAFQTKCTCYTTREFSTIDGRSDY
jgi:hypothetical protein